MHHVSPVRREKTSVSSVLTDTPAKVTLEAKLEARAKSVTCSRLFSDSPEM
jgi:hypothetical protein